MNTSSFAKTVENLVVLPLVESAPTSARMQPITLPTETGEDISDSPRSLQIEPVGGIEREILMEQMEELNSQLSKLRFENELLKRRAKGEPTKQTEEEKAKDTLLQSMKDELNELHVSYGQLHSIMTT
jgi:hypothetical protein